jgi:hypothetical protein
MIGTASTATMLGTTERWRTGVLAVLRDERSMEYVATRPKGLSAACGRGVWIDDY